MEPTLIDRNASLRSQHAACVREGYDGHNRRAGLTTMRRLALRRARRLWHQRLATLAFDRERPW